ncbi:hypothetical protein J2T15_003597 [Paenibacillus harenae]|uniref:Uncharacterized protein n=1 Tax=Paenibacillus harenae TaxID=306543 RepID=A0ABT9U3C6_PAEHA|nr:hypothetical protein [Paenibacillus harenae]
MRLKWQHFGKAGWYREKITPFVPLAWQLYAAANG